MTMEIQMRKIKLGLQMCVEFTKFSCDIYNTDG